MNQWWAVDIETVAAPALALQTLRQRNGQEIRRLIEADKNLPPGKRRLLQQNLVDPVKIEADAKAKIAKALEVVRSTDALDPMTAQPICICATRLSDIQQDYQGVINAKPTCSLIWSEWGWDDKSPKNYIPDFYEWCRAERPRLVGFNSRDFDFPCLALWYARAAGLDQVPQPFVAPLWMGWCDLLLELGGYYTKQHTTSHRLIDYVATLLSPEAHPPGPVHDYLRSEFTGEQVAQAYMDGEADPTAMDKIVEHNRLDSLMVALLAVKTQAVRG